MSSLLKRESRTVLGTLALLVFMAGCSANPHTISAGPRGGTSGESESTGAGQQRSQSPSEPGAPGANGTDGEDGSPGTQGEGSSSSGTNDAQGLAGARGAGTPGQQGVPGAAGSSGVDGTNGTDGSVVVVEGATPTVGVPVPEVPSAQLPAAPRAQGLVIEESTIDLQPATPSASAPSTSTASEPVVATESVAQASSEPVVIRGADGAPGRAGADGCGIVTFNQDFHARRLRAEELVLVETNFPYQSTRRHQIRTYQVGNPQTHQCGLPVMSNGQMVFAVDVTLPNFTSFRSTRETDLIISVTKMVRGRGERNFLSTELLCLLNGVNKCSGEAMTARNWLDNRRGSFFANGDPVLSDLFSRALVDSPVERSCGGRRVFAAYNVNLDLQEALPGVDLSQEIYGSSREDSVSPYVTNTLFFVVADDTFVSEARMNIQLTYDSCRVNSLSQAQAGSQ
jgi:hypothetical protein